MSCQVYITDDYRLLTHASAGTNVTLHKDAAWKESWRDFKESSRLMQSLFSLKSTYNESENPLISTARSIGVGSGRRWLKRTHPGTM